MLLPVIFSVTGLSASQHSDCDTSAAGGVGFGWMPLQRRPTLEWVALESEPWSSMTSRHPSPPVSERLWTLRLACTICQQWKQQEHFPVCSQGDGRGGRFPSQARVREDSCRALSSGLQTPSCNRLRRAGRGSRVMTDSPKHQEVVGGWSALGCHQSPRLL